MAKTAQKVVEIIYDLLFIGKTAAVDIQISSDAAMAKKINKAIEEKDIEKVRRLVTKGGILVDKKDILGIIASEQTPAIVVSPNFVVKYRQMFKDIRRYKRAKGSTS